MHDDAPPVPDQRGITHVGISASLGRSWSLGGLRLDGRMVEAAAGVPMALRHPPGRPALASRRGSPRRSSGGPPAHLAACSHSGHISAPADRENPSRQAPPDGVMPGQTAEGVGFEPTVTLPPQWFSRPSPSATRRALLWPQAYGNPERDVSRRGQARPSPTSAVSVRYASAVSALSNSRSTSAPSSRCGS
jgi:hypothetical protein